MIYLFENANNNASVVYDGSVLTQVQKDKAIQVEHLPAKETPQGKVAILKVSKATNEVWWEYKDAPVDTDNLHIEALKQAIAELTILIAGGM